MRGVDSIKNNKSSGKKRDRARSRVSVEAWIIIVVILLIGAIILFPRDIFSAPNTRIEYTEPPITPHEETNQLLASVDHESDLKNASATITFPDGGSFTITAEEAGFSPDIELMVAAVGVGMRGTGNTEFNEDYVRGVVAANTKRFNDALVDEACNILRDSIVIIKGSSVEPADEKDVYDLTVATLYMAIDEQAHMTADFSPKTSKQKELDLMMLYERIFVEPASAYYNGETHRVDEEVMGVRFDMAEAQKMMDQAAEGTKIVIPLIFTMPEVTSRQLGRTLFRDVLAERTTRISGTNNRLNNIQLSSAAVNGTILAPDEVFSFNGIVGERTAEKGYLEAGAYVNNETIQEIGGGICQTSSTIYDCVLHSDLEVIERLNHMFTVAYLPLGNDATINWGTADLKFRNNTEYPIRIEATVIGRDLTVRLIGTKTDDNYIEIDFKLISMTPYDTIRQEDESVPQGATVDKSDGHTGYVVETYKYLYDKDGNLISETLVDKSVYLVQDRVILIPPEPESEDQESEDQEPGDPESEDPGEKIDESLPPDTQSPPPEELPDETSENMPPDLPPQEEEAPAPPEEPDALP